DEGFAITAAALVNQRAVPLAGALQKWNNGIAALDSTIEHDVRVEAHQFAFVIAVAVARSGASGLDVAEHGAGVAADGVVSHARLRSLSQGSRRELGRGSREFCGCERRRHHESR